jgi:hypothetical protein
MLVGRPLEGNELCRDDAKTFVLSDRYVRVSAIRFEYLGPPHSPSKSKALGGIGRTSLVLGAMSCGLM